MCDDCKVTTIDCHSGHVEVEVAGWGTWNIWLQTEAESFLPSVLLSPRDALRLAWTLVRSAVRLWRLQRRQRRDFSSSVHPEGGGS
jgi:hypothetical protein